MSYVHACSTLELCQYISLVVRRFLPTSMCSTRSLWHVCRCFLRTFHQKALRHVCRQSCGEKEGVCSPQWNYLSEVRICRQAQIVGLNCKAQLKVLGASQLNSIQQRAVKYASEYLLLLSLPLLFASCSFFLLSAGSNYVNVSSFCVLKTAELVTDT